MKSKIGTARYLDNFRIRLPIPPLNLSSVMNMYSITTHLSHPYKSQENEAAVAIEKQEAWYK